MAVRKIVRIDEEKCDGCGDCVPSCAEGAIQIIEGKARLVSEVYCDGLGACLGNCHRGAISIEEREAADFNEKEVERHLDGMKKRATPRVVSAPPKMGGCPGSMARQLQRPSASSAPSRGAPVPSQLANWPVQLTLVPPNAPYFQEADLLLAADCAPFACSEFHGKILQGQPLVIGCPKLDDGEAYVQKLAQIFTHSNPKSLTIVHMEVPCCLGLLRIAEAAMEMAGMEIPLRQIVVGVQGEILQGPGGAPGCSSGQAPGFPGWGHPAFNMRRASL